MFNKFLAAYILMLVSVVWLTEHVRAAEYFTTQSGVQLTAYAETSPSPDHLHAIPDVVDWNNDGYDDLVVGYYDYFLDEGPVMVILNEGTHGATDLDVFDPQQADGTTISMAGSS
ncbi:hypothetical protein BVX97_02970 [bacterium E08(2017)]|nr:hypothetical protein BVX97_02970 [bacterium E08(2017)]